MAKKDTKVDETVTAPAAPADVVTPAEQAVAKPAPVAARSDGKLGFIPAMQRDKGKARAPKVTTLPNGTVVTDY